jgi:uncharacterized integral membrane protein
MIRLLTYFSLFLLLIGVGIFVGQNQQAIALKFINLESINLPLGLTLTISAGLGAIFTTALQVSSRNASRQLNPKFTVPNQTSKSKPAKAPAKDRIADFDDEVDDDWV